MKVTPMMEQYLSAKEAHPEAILFFRMGDFYEMFFEDAVTVAREIGLTLTSRNKGDVDEVPMAGVPHKAAEGYVAKLIERGFNVAICDQLEEPSKGAGIVRRGVTRIITPGVISSSALLDERAPNYLAATVSGSRKGEHVYALAYIDATTGDFRVTEVSDLGQLEAELARVSVSELLVPDDQAEIFEGLRETSTAPLRHFPAASFDRVAVLADVVRGDTLDSDLASATYLLDDATASALFRRVEGAHFRIPEASVRAVAGVLAYLVYTQRGIGCHIREIVPYKVEDFLIIDDATRANLELTETMMGRRRKGSLLDVIDATVSAMGSRQLRSWLAYPLVDAARINRRLEAVEELVGDVDLRESVRDRLAATYDIERLTGKIVSGLANARDLLALARTLTVVPELRRLVSVASCESLSLIGQRLDPCDDLCATLTDAIVDDPPVGVRDGGLFREGFHDELDELISLSRDSKDWLLRFEGEQRASTGISSLKVKYNKVFGYFIDVTKANLHLVPEEYVRKQTLANSERFFTDDLKEYEERVLTAEDRRIDLEYRLFEELRATCAEYVGRLRHTAYLLATLDVLGGLAEVAHRHSYVRPVVSDAAELRIVDGRHPVVERTLRDERFVPNGVELDCDTNQLLIITGPNMAGKSTIIRQVALITILAQMGSFVPAARAEIGVADRIFSRVGASDNLAMGHSTFMVEMTETAHILSNATARSLIILDEIGRGTSTYDGLAIAWAVAEYLHDEIGAKTLFATHYHELTSLMETMAGVRNFNIAVKEWKDDVIFLRRLVPGPANKSYGIQVGRLAGLPAPVVRRAKEILANLEDAAHDDGGTPLIARQADGSTRVVEDSPQLSLLAGSVVRRREPDKVTASRSDPAEQDAIAALRAAEINTMTPLDALNFVHGLRNKLRG